MGLTIHYRVEANPDWTRRQIRQKLEDTRRFAQSLPVASVSEVVEFRDKDCDWRSGTHDGETPEDADARDPYRWAKIQASRYVQSPWRPGLSQETVANGTLRRWPRRSANGTPCSPVWAASSKDAAEAQGVGFESSMSGRPDFERLEVEATKIGNVAEHLAAPREHLVPAFADHKEQSL